MHPPPPLKLVHNKERRRWHNREKIERKRDQEKKKKLTGVQTLGDSRGFDQIAFTHVAGDEVVKVLHQVFPG